MQTREKIDGPNGRKAIIIISTSDTRACLDWYEEATPQHLGRVLGGEGPFHATELDVKLEAVRKKATEALV